MEKLEAELFISHDQSFETARNYANNEVPELDWKEVLNEEREVVTTESWVQ